MRSFTTAPFWSAGNPTRLTVPADVSKVRLKGNINWTFGGSGYRHIWMHKNGALFFGAAKESDEGDSGVQSIGSVVVGVTPGDYFEFITRRTSGATLDRLQGLTQIELHRRRWTMVERIALNDQDVLLVVDVQSDSCGSSTLWSTSSTRRSTRSTSARPRCGAPAKT
jgi:hypothetical protein